MTLRLRHEVGTVAATDTEWLVTSGNSAYAMGTVSGLRTRRYHGLLVAPDPVTGHRHLGLAALDPQLLLGAGSVELGTRQWADGTVAPDGQRYMVGFEVVDGAPRITWRVGEVAYQREFALQPGSSVVGVVDTLIAAPGPVRVRVDALATWRAAGGEHHGKALALTTDDGGFVLESRLQVRGRSFRPDGRWWFGAHYPHEADRGLAADEDLMHVGAFEAQLRPGESWSFLAWVGDAPGTTGERVIAAARDRTRGIIAAARPDDDVDRTLAHAADQFVVRAPGLDVIAGYPWFGCWSRDSLTAFEGLFLATNRWTEGAEFLERLGGTVSEGMLANTADFGSLEYNTVDAAMWFFHAVSRYQTVTDDVEVPRRLVSVMDNIVANHVRGTRFGVRVTSDGLVTQGQPGYALTWMDARVDGVAMTARIGKPVEVNALWIEGLSYLGQLKRTLGLPQGPEARLHPRALSSFLSRFPSPRGGLADVVDVPGGGDDLSVRPNQLIAATVAGIGVDFASLARAAAPLSTPLGPRSLAPGEPGYAPRYAGPMPVRDSVYHQGTVWPWLVGPYVDALVKAGLPVAGVLDGLVGHLGSAGLGSVCEVADGDTPHRPGGCTFQAWSVAELVRAKRLVEGRR